MAELIFTDFTILVFVYIIVGKLAVAYISCTKLDG